MENFNIFVSNCFYKKDASIETSLVKDIKFL